MLQFVNQSRTGGTKALQDAIRDELQFITSRVATELSSYVPELNPQTREVAASLIVSTLLENTTNLLSMPDDNDTLREELKERTIDQMNIILQGARNWAADAPSREDK